MKLTLRKANALQNAIQDQIKTIGVEVMINLNEFQNATHVVVANAELIKNDNRRVELLTALYEIRELVGMANATSGVNGLLSRAAFIDKRIGQLKCFTEATVAEESDIVNRKLSKIRNDTSDNRMYGYQTSITTGILSQDQIDTFKTSLLGLKKSKQELNDKMLELNITTEITLSQSVVNTLKSEQLI